MSNVWENTDGCTNQYRCATVLYLLLVLAHAYNIIIYHGAGSPGHIREVFYDLNYTNKWFLSMLMTTLKLPSAANDDTQMVMHTSTVNTEIILAS